MSRNHRSAKNFLVRPREQLRFAVIFFAGGAALLCLYVIILLTSLISSVNTIVRQYDLPPEVTPALLSSLQTSMLFVGIFGLIITVSMLAFGVTFSHRIFGPLIPMESLIRKLKAGDYGARGSLRKNDEFKELMTELNELAAALQARHGQAMSGATGVDPS